ncbi:hypothetical protein Mal52_23720 [Symmachiella dynata]|uniref:Uncharacterized protein n=1 Tax=Symmachiella dynata TaxID=2527995 RepID=A0A517ZN47_9PLAN|nr:hypothetical protein [Symmachiella dynata]QDU43895.1 hypothetical protein Mal52_23720 [Symmachiella dynata]
MSNSRSRKKSGRSNSRSPVEMAIIWGGILILVGLAFYEFRARSTYNSNYQAVMDAFQAAEESGESLTDEEVAKLVTGHSSHEKNNKIGPNKLLAERMDRYEFKGLIQNREIYVYYGSHGEDGIVDDVFYVGEQPAAEGDAPADDSAN